MLPDRLQQLVADLDDKLFLEGHRYDQAKALAVETFRNAPTRPSVFAGKSYEADPEKLSQQLDGFFSSKEGPDKTPSEHAGQRLKGLVTPSFDLKEAGPLYAWAYKELQEAETPSVFVVLGTCHAGLEGGIAVTDKDFETPLGVVPVNHAILDAFRNNGERTIFQRGISTCSRT